MAKRDLFAEIREGLIAYRDSRGSLARRELSPPDIKAIRERFGLSQSQMAVFMNVHISTLQNWEQGRRNPTGPAQTLLRIMEKEPEAFQRALHAS